MYLWIALLFLGTTQQLVQGVPSTKKCVAHWADNFNCSDFEVLNNINCWYDWRCNLTYFHNNDICSDVIDNYADNYVSMIWGVYPINNYTCHHDMQTPAVMGMNEPNHPNQSNRTAAEVVAIWSELKANSNGLPLISPSAAKCGSGCAQTELEWWDEFFLLCNGSCNVTYLAVHTYWCNADKVMNYLEMLYNRYNRPIWLTEFACRPNVNNRNEGRIKRFMEDILPRLEAADYVIKYFWYMARIPDNTGYIGTYGSLFRGYTTELTEPGEFYNNYNPS